MKQEEKKQLQSLGLGPSARKHWLKRVAADQVKMIELIGGEMPPSYRRYLRRRQYLHLQTLPQYIQDSLIAGII